MEIKFGTGGYRGIIGESLTEETVVAIAESVFQIIKEDGLKNEVVIGYDRREKSFDFALIIANTLLKHQTKVNILDCKTPTPTLMYQVRKLATPFGFMVTASHNPSKFNGIKVVVSGGYDASKQLTDRIEKIIKNLTNFDYIQILDKKNKNLVFFNGLNDYVNNIINFSNTKIKKTLKIAYDNIYGVGIASIKTLFSKLDIPLVIFNEEDDPSFGGKLPDPTENNLSDLKKYVIKNHFDLGFGCDSDADRLAIIDEKGNYLSMNMILAIIYYYLIKYEKKTGPIIKNICTSTLIDLLANKFNEKCYVVDVGFKNITAAMKEHDAILGGESSGGFTMRDYLPGKDSSFGIYMFLCAISKIGKPISQICKEIIEFTGYNLVSENINIPLKLTENEVLSMFANNPPNFTEKVIKVTQFNNNIRFELEDNQWIAIRVSGTEPIIRIFLELKSVELIRKQEKIINDYIKLREDQK